MSPSQVASRSTGSPGRVARGSIGRSALRRAVISDRDEGRRTRLEMLLGRRGYDVTAGGPAALTPDGSGELDVLLCDLETALASPGALAGLAGRGGPFVVVLVRSGDRERALELVTGGERAAHDCLTDPIDNLALALVLARAEALADARAGVAAPLARPRPSAPAPAAGFAGMVGGSAAMRQVYRTVELVAEHKAGVLITGESGTGKELVARAIHDLGARADRPFVAINCGAIPPALLESELFGYRKGAFTDAVRDKRGWYQEADGGTLFLDEIGEMPLELQVKLLRALQEEEIRPLGDSRSVSVDARVIAATVRDLPAEIAAGRFREDLYYRLNVLPIELPPLRDRPEDIEPLVRHFARSFAGKHGLDESQVEVAPDLVERLERHPWPGNIRELENTIERAIVLADGGRLDASVLGERPGRTGGVAAAPAADGDLSIKRGTRALEETLIKRALEETGGNRTSAAKLLEISHRALLYKIKEYKL